MQEELTALEPELKRKSKETEELMQRLSVDQEQATQVRRQELPPSIISPSSLLLPLSLQVRTVVAQEEAVANKKAEETKAIADDAKKDLDQALPALQAANKVGSHTNPFILSSFTFCAIKLINIHCTTYALPVYLCRLLIPWTRTT